MSIWKKLFLFLLTIVLLMNLVTFFIYQSGRTIKTSYNLMMDRIMLYKQIANLTEDNLRYLTNYLLNQNQAAYVDFFNRKQELRDLKTQLDNEKRTETRAAAVQNYSHMVDSFFEAEEAIIGILYSTENRNYSKEFDDMSKIAGYIQDEDLRLVDQELSFYQPYYKKMLLYNAHMNDLGKLLLAVDLLLCIVFSLWLAGSITRPIIELAHTALQISKGNLEVNPPISRRNDEVAILTKAFRHMLSYLKELLEKNKEVMEKDRLVKELEIKALQSQINPHFLFNTLNVVSKLALLEGAERTSELTVSVSNLLRYNLRKLDAPVTLRDEVGHAMEYFAIQQTRFRDRVSFETNIDDTLLDLPIPSLTLQPILENAFVHGIEGMEEDARICLDIRRAGDEAVVSISDNGVGIDEETSRALLSASSGFADAAASASGQPNGQPNGQAKGKSTGLGARNVYRRLQLFYGKDDLVSIDSVAAGGTTVRIRVPIP